MPPLLNHYTYQDVAARLGDKRMRKVANSVYAARPTRCIIHPEEIHVSYHSWHVIIMTPNGDVYIRPPDPPLHHKDEQALLQRLNRFLPLGYTVFASNNEWYIHRAGQAEELVFRGAWFRYRPFLTVMEST